jgi:heterodisulfide reductase subunit C
LCPYEVSPISFIEAIKAKAFEEGQAHPVIQSEVSNILSTGYAFPLTSASQRQRQQLGLDPPDTSSAEELRLIAEKLGSQGSSVPRRVTNEVCLIYGVFPHRQAPPHRESL